MVEVVVMVVEGVTVAWAWVWPVRGRGGAGLRLLTDLEDLPALAGTGEDEVQQGGLPLPGLSDGCDHQPRLCREIFL